MLSDAGFTQIFNFTLRFGKRGLDIEVPFRISEETPKQKPFHYITGYIIWINI